MTRPGSIPVAPFNEVGTFGRYTTAEDADLKTTALAAASRIVARCCARRREVQAAYIFGSVAQGRARLDSDIDIAVLVSPSIRHGRALSYRLTLANDLGEALGRSDVHVVILNDAPPLLAQRVLSLGTLVFERSPTARVRFQVQVARRYADAVPTFERYIRHLKKDVREGRLGG